MKNIKTTLIVSAAIATFAIGCGNSEKEQIATSEPPLVELPETLIAAAALPNAIGVVAAREAVEPGKEIVLAGFIGGREDPFVEGRAIFTLADSEALTSCDANPDDGCTTPWDACCEAPEKIKASIASVQVVDRDGTVLKHKLEGFGGIGRGARVSVKGTIAPGSTSDSLILNAEQIHVTSKP